MALGGTPILWDESSPSGAESVGLGDDRIRSLKTSARNALDSEHVWPSSSSSAGAHREGSARAFFGAQSAVSATSLGGTENGRMMIASNSSRLFGVGSGGTVLLGGGPLGPIFNQTFVGLTMPQRAHVAMETGETASDGGGQFSITFSNSGFSGIPFFLATPSSDRTTHSVAVRPAFISASLCTGDVIETSTGAMENNTNFNWLSIGTRTL